MLPRLESNALLLSAGQLKIRIFLSSSKVQALREFLLLTSSDWPFLITEKQAEDYGAKRFREHAERFDRLMDYAEAMLDEEEPKVSEDEIIGYLSYVSALDNPFPNLRFSVLGRQNH